MKRSGACLCGAVRFDADLGDHQLSTCHCGMCLRWSGGPPLTIGTRSLTWTQGEEHIRTYDSSTIAERGFCSRCGTSLFYRLTAEGPYRGFTSIFLGALEDTSGFELSREWFHDQKPGGYAFAGERTVVTEAEAMAMLDDA